MLKLFKRAKSKRTARFTETVHLARSLIESQISISDGRASHKKIFDVYACAYIFGFADAMLTKAGAEDELQAKMLIMQTFMQIFGNDPGSKIMGKSLRMQTDPEFQRARDLGSSEAAAWLASSGDDIPMGLSEYLNAP